LRVALLIAGNRCQGLRGSRATPQKLSRLSRQHGSDWQRELLHLHLRLHALCNKRLSTCNGQYKIKANQPTRNQVLTSARSDLQVGRDARPKRTKSKPRNKGSVKVLRKQVTRARFDCWTRKTDEQVVTGSGCRRGGRGKKLEVVCFAR
jgi:hypothetical protein